MNPQSCDVLMLARHAYQDHSTLRLSAAVTHFYDGGLAGVVDEYIGSGTAVRLGKQAGDGDARRIRLVPGAVECMRGAELLGQGQLGVVQIDGDDGIGRDHASRLDDIESNAAGTKDHDGFADTYFGIVFNDAESRSHRTAEERGHFQVAVRRDGGHAVFGHNGIVVECGDPTGIDLAALPEELRRLGLNSSAFAPMHDDLIAGLHVAHSRADGQDRA